MKLYTVTYEEISIMSLDEVKAMIATIENDPEMWSAEMADRLQGREKEEYEHNQNTLYFLYQRKATLTPPNANRIKANIEYYNEEIAKLEKQNEAKQFWKNCDSKMWEIAQSSISWNNEQIQKYKDKIEECNKQLAAI